MTEYTLTRHYEATIHEDEDGQTEAYLAERNWPLADLISSACLTFDMSGDTNVILWKVADQESNTWWVEDQPTNEDAEDGLTLVYGPVEVEVDIVDEVVE